MKLIHVFSIFGTAESFFDGQYRYLTEKGYEIVVVSSPSDHTEDFCKRNGVRYVPLNIPRSVSPIAIAKAVRVLCGLIRAERTDAVFGHTPVGALCAMIAARLSGIKNRVYYRHGVIYTTMHGLKRFIFKTEERFVAGLATDIINVSHSLSRLAAADHLNAENKQYVIGEGTCGGIDTQNIFNPALIDAERLATLKSKTLQGEADIVFGFCGRICNDKGISELVDAFELFLQRHKELHAQLLLIGRYDYRDRVSEEKRQQIESTPNIIVTGSVEKSIIPYYYAMLDVFVFPSHREGFGMCSIEAAAMEKPVLCSHAHGCEDAIADGKTGEYIPLAPEGICKGMESMLDADQRRRLGKNGRERVVTCYDANVMWPMVSKLYEAILSK